MFSSKRKQLFIGNKQQTTSAFISTALKDSAVTTSGNGAKKYSTTGNPFVDQFGKIGSYRKPRDFSEIEKDCELLWAEDKQLCVLFIFYLRTINRTVQYFDGSVTSVPQKGGELKHESIMRLLWLHNKSQDTFWKNITLFITLGSWKDVITMLSYDLQYHGWEGRKLNWSKFRDLILSGIENKNTSELLKKYLPQIKTNSKCKTVSAQANNITAKWICSILFECKQDDYKYYKQYRILKSSGTAHEWQKLISQRKFDRIDFNKIHGRALNLLVRSKFLDNQGLREKYQKWVEKPETEVKYTGFVHELFQDFKWTYYGYKPTLSNVPIHVQETINKQFATLVDKGGEQQQTALIVVRDTSSSMGANAHGANMSCYNVAKALALYFSEFLSGTFSNSWIEFNRKAIMHQWKGNTPIERWFNDLSSVIGSTNFQSVIDLFCELRKSVAEDDFPKGILCISDGEFNPSALSETNVGAAKEKLLAFGFSRKYVNDFIIILWNLQSNFYGKGTGQKFETYGNVNNVFYFSGYSASTISFLTNKIKNADELFNEAMNQEVLNKIEL
jgi:hypothetical protein